MVVGSGPWAAALRRQAAGGTAKQLVGQLHHCRVVSDVVGAGAGATSNPSSGYIFFAVGFVLRPPGAGDIGSAVPRKRNSRMGRALLLLLAYATTTMNSTGAVTSALTTDGGARPRAASATWAAVGRTDGQPRYRLSAVRANSAQPVVATRHHMPTPVNASHTAASTFFFNFNPTFLTLPDHTPAIILRSVARQRDPATTSNPDVLTLSRVRTTGDSGRITAGTPVVIDPVNESSVILRPSPNSTLDNRGVQDPRVMQDPARKQTHGVW